MPVAGKHSPFRPMIVGGIMSGTSADGIDVALVKITPQRSALHLELVGHSAFSFPRALRQAVLAAMDAKSTSTAELARLNWRLGQAYAEAARATLKQHPCNLQLIGCHGQTIYHQAAARPYAGRNVACTWQIGEPSLLAAEMRLPVVSNFRPADMVAGGQGAPLVPLLDYVMFADAKRARILQNIGGIGNLTAIRAQAAADAVLAFDTGPGNMVIDALMQKLFDRPYDKGGKTAAQGHVLDPVLNRSLRHPFFRRKPPKSAGREEFGEAFAREFYSACKAAGGSKADAVTTATALTAESIALAYTRFVEPIIGSRRDVDVIVSGGGAKNATLLAMIGARLSAEGCRVMESGAAGIPVDAKEAVAFALLAYYTWHGRAANVPSATGAARPAILGQITYA